MVDKAGSTLYLGTKFRQSNASDSLKGKLVTNGCDLTVKGKTTGASVGILDITTSELDGTSSLCSLATLDQSQGKLRQVLVEGAGATVYISGTHTLNYDGHPVVNYFLVSGSGATVTYLTGGLALGLTISSGVNTTGCGWRASDGTVNFYGNITATFAGSSRAVLFDASGANVNLIGPPASVDFALTNAGSVYWDFGNLSINKATGASVTFKSSMAVSGLVRASGGLTVCADNTLDLQGVFAVPSGYEFASVVNNGTITRTTGTNNNIRVTGTFTNNDTFTNSLGTCLLRFDGDFSNSGGFTNGGAAADMTFGGTLTNSGHFGIVNTASLTANGLVWNKPGGQMQRSNAASTGAFDCNAGFTNDGQYSATVAASPLRVLNGSAFVNSGTFTNSAGNVTISGTCTNSGTIDQVAYTASGTLTFTGAFENTSTGIFRDRFQGAGGASRTFGSSSTTAGTFEINNTSSLSVAGLVWNKPGGSLRLLSGTSAAGFNGGLTNDGTYTNSANCNVSVTGNLENSSSFSAGTGTYTLSGSSWTISGTLTIPTLTVNGSYTNNGNLTVSTTLAGTGTLTNGAGAMLVLSGTATISNLNATASDNTVNYNGGDQTVLNARYYNLTLSGSLTKTLQTGTNYIDGNLVLSGSTRVSTVAAPLTVSGDVSVAAGCSLKLATTSNFTATGTTSITGTPAFVTAAGGSKTFGNVIVNAGSRWLNNTVNSSVEITGNLANYGTFTAGSGVYYFTGTGQTVSGTFTIPSVSLTNAVTNKGTLTISGNASGGSLVNDVNSKLYLGVTSLLTTALDADANPNTVVYNGTGAQYAKPGCVPSSYNQ